MNQTIPQCKEWQGMTPRQFREDIIPSYRPAVFRRYIRHWPAVSRSLESDANLARYIQSFDNGKEVVTYTGAPGIGGRFFYQDGLGGFNFERVKEKFHRAVDRVLEQKNSEQPLAVYSGAVNILDNIPDFSTENHCDLPSDAAIARIWVGTAATVSTHYDMMDNVICAVAGRRRITLFPPEQLANLYVGPIDFTLSGQPVSMVNLKQPDLVRFPRFKDALAQAQVVVLEPGDALYIPKLWWHHIESLESFNVIVNYWWDQTAMGSDTPFTTLLHGLLTIKHLPEPERQAWKAFFDHYLFHGKEDPLAHIPEPRRGILGKMTPRLYDIIKKHVAVLMNR